MKKWRSLPVGASKPHNHRFSCGFRPTEFAPYPLLLPLNPQGQHHPGPSEAFRSGVKKVLSDKVFGKDVVVIPKTKDKYGRTVGHVLIDGRDVNLLMLEEGMAWHYKNYDHNARLARAEEEARAAKKGLWADREPVPPWEWRKEDQHRKATVKP